MQEIKSCPSCGDAQGPCEAHGKSKADGSVSFTCSRQGGRVDGGDPARLFEDLAVAAAERGDNEAAAVLRDAQRIEDQAAQEAGI